MDIGLIIMMALVSLVPRAQPDPGAPGPDATKPAAPPRLVLARAISLPGVSGRIDHLACDRAGKRLFIAALGNGSLEVVDLEKGERTGSVAGLKEPQGVEFVPGTGRVMVACGGDGTVRAYDASTLEEKAKATLGKDADNVHIEAGGAAIVVAHSSGAIARLDAATLKPLTEYRLKDHPEGFAIDPRGARIFVNIPGGFVGGGGSVAVIDTAAAKTTTWKLTEAGRNFPMALDAPSKRLYIGCRRPAKLVVLDTDTGRVISAIPCTGDADDIFVDPESSSIFVIAGDDGGAIDIVQTRDHNTFTNTTRVKTSPGARTGLLVPEQRTLYVAAPARSGKPAEVLEYTVQK